MAMAFSAGLRPTVPGGCDTAPDGEITCPLRALAEGERQRIRVLATASAVGTRTFSARLADPGDVYDLVTGNDDAPLTELIIREPDGGDGQAPGAPGGPTPGPAAGAPGDDDGVPGGGLPVTGTLAALMLVLAAIVTLTGLGLRRLAPDHRPLGPDDHAPDDDLDFPEAH